MPSPEIRKKQLQERVRKLADRHSKVYDELTTAQRELQVLEAQESIFVTTRREAARTVASGLFMVGNQGAVDVYRPKRTTTVMEVRGPMGGLSAQVSFDLLVNGDLRHVKCNIYDMTDTAYEDIGPFG
jgi:hypothetical protein